MTKQEIASQQADSAILQLDSFLPYRLNVVTQAVSQALARLYSEEFDISVPEWRILAALGESRIAHGAGWPGMTARDLTQHSRMGKVMVSRAAATLLDRRILAKRANHTDRRESFLRLTAKGAKIYAAIVPRAQAFQASLEVGLSRRDAAAFDRVVLHLLRRAHDADAALRTE
ncbi:MAG: MarR family winged helix-turn-helix transcriptional regulator [Beijerinckiaceae bacterium]|jgi:DNA-binding MarR family transcriptional regulator|nr:MarR family winged helix-turn-helix transcriptional regulator [Beijerinckiaceae bacterium]